MIKRQNGEYYVSPNGDKAGVMELLVKKTKELKRQVTAEDILADATMPAVNTFAGYYDGGFEAAASKAYRKVTDQAAENPEQVKEQPKSEKTPMNREEILEKVADACFQHGDNTGWINEQELRKIIPIKDVFRAFKKGGVKELRNEVKAVLYNRKHPDKRPQPQPELSAKVVIPEAILKATEPESAPESALEPNKTELEIQPAGAESQETVSSAQDSLSPDDFYVVEEDIVDSNSEEEPESEFEPESAPEPVKEKPKSKPKKAKKEVNDVTKQRLDITRLSDQDIADLYYKACVAEGGYILNQRDCLEYSREHPFPSWGSLVKHLGNWWGWGSRFGLPYKSKDASDRARKYMEEQGLPSDINSAEPKKEPAKEFAPEPIKEPESAPVKEELADTTPGPSLPSAGTKEYTYPIKITLPEGMSGTISFHLETDIIIKI